ncbi:MAG: TetR/AcrR family transcriptional regulator [Thermotogae bacterium]|nr:TetR/AcrR family transcriptional regulator [Thermotogota bacterium]MCP5465211.1 TetR/AcrR family transcriptional regulator [Thermotogota bacterium]
MPKILENPEEKIITISEKIIMREGVEKVTIRKISEAARISLGTIYNYFENKDVIICKTIELYWKNAIKELDSTCYINKYFFLDALYEKIETYQKRYQYFWKSATVHSGNRKEFALSYLDEIIKKKTDFQNSGYIIQNLTACAAWNFLTYREFKNILKAGEKDCLQQL